MSVQIRVIKGESSQTYQANIGENLLEVLRKEGYPIAAECGGVGVCKKCSVCVSGKIKVQGVETFTLATDILSCEAEIIDDLEVYLPEEKAADVSTHTNVTEKIIGQNNGLGVAVDIGTTTVAAYLYNLETGERLGVASGLNAQRAYGADVISRAHYTMTTENGLQTLFRTVVDQLFELSEKLVQEAGYSLNDITEFSIAGNTIMQHIFANLPVSGIAVAPFKPESLFGNTISSESIGLLKNASIYLAPCISGYVGGDITAGMLSCDFLKSGNSLFIDIGTNGEMGINTKDGIITCSVAAGPAFEGAEMDCGSVGVAGAISKVAYENGTLTYQTLMDAPAIGICGSGLLDAIAIMLEHGAIDETGRMLDKDEAEGWVKDYIEEREDGPAFYIDKEKNLYISNGDIRKVQLGKAAVAAGIKMLLAAANTTMDEIDHVFLAGGFGNSFDKHSAATIGLIPAPLENKIEGIGNAAASGAIMALNVKNRANLDKIQEKSGYIELSSNKEFMDKYVENMSF